MIDLLVFDLDSTIFDTGLFADTLWSILHDEFGVNRRAVSAQATQFYAYVGDLYYYDFFAHLDALGLDKDAVERAVRAELAGTGFGLYDDVLPCASRLPAAVEVMVLTFGERRYQELKYACTGLRWPLHAVLEPKGPWLAARFAGRKGIMVDDRAVPDLPPTINGLQINRTNPTKTQIASLADIGLRITTP